MNKVAYFVVSKIQHLDDFHLICFDLTQIEDLETLKEASEDDLRKSGLKMGDIIKIRRLLANPKSSELLDNSLSSLSESMEENLLLGDLEVEEQSPRQVRFIVLSVSA